MANLNGNSSMNPIRDSLQTEKNNFNLGGREHPLSHSQSYNSKSSMKQLYKIQLDSMMHEKQIKRAQEKQVQALERKQFNQRLSQNKQAQRMKEMSYKNYYNILLSNQTQHQQSYVSPYSRRETMKDTLISHNMQDERKKIQVWDALERKQQVDRKSDYRKELVGQIQEKKRRQLEQRGMETRKKEEYRQFSQLPEQITKFQRDRKLEDMAKYRHDLDLVRQEKQVLKRSRTEAQNIRYPEYQHNAILNPLPYNIQNPYIMREMNVQQGTHSQNVRNPIHPEGESHQQHHGSQHF